MILTDVQKYLLTTKRASLEQLEMRFGMSGEALRGMLERLVRKGRVRRNIGEKCSHCCNCSPETIEFYEWIEAEEQP
ncbi:MAG: sugar metabolism transcriptional regulator [Cyanobacteria bacterium SBLK]|nr:sugar metabolism transcriptional regulator [Cyanobacteria bacterium SBLK]